VQNRDWYLMVGPENSEAPLHVRQNVFMFDAHPRKGDTLEVPVYDGYKQFLYVMYGEISIGEMEVEKFEAVTDMDEALPIISANEDATIVLFLVDIDAPMSLAGTISGMTT